MINQGCRDGTNLENDILYINDDGFLFMYIEFDQLCEHQIKLQVIFLHRFCMWCCIIFQFTSISLLWARTNLLFCYIAHEEYPVKSED